MSDFWLYFELGLTDVAHGTGIVTSNLRGYNKLDGVNSNHHARISCNGVLVSDVYFTGWDQVGIEAVVTIKLLKCVVFAILIFLHLLPGKFHQIQLNTI